MHYDDRYLGGWRLPPCFLVSGYSNKKAGLPDLYSITHVTVVVDPIRAKSCRSFALLVCGRSVIVLPVDQQ